MTTINLRITSLLIMQIYMADLVSDPRKFQPALGGLIPINPLFLPLAMNLILLHVEIVDRRTDTVVIITHFFFQLWARCCCFVCWLSALISSSAKHWHLLIWLCVVVLRALPSLRMRGLLLFCDSQFDWAAAARHDLVTAAECSRSISSLVKNTAAER